MLVRFLKRHPELREKVRVIMRHLSRNPHNIRHKAHALSAELKGAWAASITHKYRIVFYLDAEVIWFVSIGSHDEVY